MRRTGALAVLAAAFWASPAFAAGTHLAHIVVIVQENRSFDNLFQGFPGADTASSGKDSYGETIPLTQISLAVPYDIDHGYGDFDAAYDNGRMDGFNLEYACCQSTGPHPQYGFVPRTETKPYFAMARQYVLGDRMFTSNIDESFVSHQYIIAAQAGGTVNLPLNAWGCDGGPSDTIATLLANRTAGPPVTVCFDYQTLGDELDRAGLTWRYYTGAIDGAGGEWSAYQAVRHIRYGPDWVTDVITPQKRFLADVKAGTLANVTWITPTCRNSDHSGCEGTTGPHWVASLVNAIGTSSFWNSTAIFVMWDEWGGWYDHVPPPYVDYDGLGFRVPLLVISPYAKRGYVSHVQYEHGSILKFIEDNFGLGRLAASDARANSPTDCFDFGSGPRPFKRIPTIYNEAYFMAQPPDGRVPDAQ